MNGIPTSLWTSLLMLLHSLPTFQLVVLLPIPRTRQADSCLTALGGTRCTVFLIYSSSRSQPNYFPFQQALSDTNWNGHFLPWVSQSPQRSRCQQTADMQELCWEACLWGSWGLSHCDLSLSPVEKGQEVGLDRTHLRLGTLLTKWVFNPVSTEGALQPTAVG